MTSMTTTDVKSALRSCILESDGGQIARNGSGFAVDQQITHTLVLAARVLCHSE